MQDAASLTMAHGAALRPVRPSPHRSPQGQQRAASMSMEHRRRRSSTLQLTRCDAEQQQGTPARRLFRRRCSLAPEPITSSAPPGPSSTRTRPQRCYYHLHSTSATMPPSMIQFQARTPIAMSTSHHLASRGAGGRLTCRK